MSIVAINLDGDFLILIKRVEKILMDELPIIPIYTYTRIYMKHESVKGWSSNLLDSHPYQYIDIE